MVGGERGREGKEGRDLRVSIASRYRERGGAVVRREIHVGACNQKRTRDLAAAILRGHVQWRRTIHPY